MSEGRAGDRDPSGPGDGPWGFRRSVDGTLEVRIPGNQRAWVRDLSEQLRELVSAGAVDDDPAVRRLFPVAYPEEPRMTAEFDEMVRDDLTRERLDAADLVERTLDAERLNEEEALAWLSTLNSLRLVLGTRLDITEEFDPLEVDEQDPDASAYFLYAFLTELEAGLVQALSAPDAG